MYLTYCILRAIAISFNNLFLCSMSVKPQTSAEKKVSISKKRKSWLKKKIIHSSNGIIFLLVRVSIQKLKIVFSIEKLHIIYFGT